MRGCSTLLRSPDLLRLVPAMVFSMVEEHYTTQCILATVENEMVCAGLSFSIWDLSMVFQNVIVEYGDVSIPWTQEYLIPVCLPELPSKTRCCPNYRGRQQLYILPSRWLPDHYWCRCYYSYLTAATVSRERDESNGIVDILCIWRKPILRLSHLKGLFHPEVMS